MNKIVFCIVFFWVISAEATTIVVKGMDKSAPVYSNPDNKDVPITEVAPGTRYEVLDTQGEWYKISIKFEEDFNITGWIHNSYVTDTSLIEEPKTDIQNMPANPDWDSYDKKKVEEKKETIEPKQEEPTNFWSGVLWKKKRSQARQAEIQVQLGTQIKDYTLKNASTGADPNPSTIIDYNQPKAFLSGLSGSVYFLSFDNFDIGLDGSYTFSWYRYDVIINNNQTSQNITSYLHTITTNVSLRYIILEKKHFVSVMPRLGFRLLSFQGDDAQDNGQPVFFSVNNTLVGLNVGLLNAEYLMPPLNPDVRFGFRGSYDVVIKPSYSESKVDSDGDGQADDVITGEDPSTAFFNHIFAISFITYFYKNYNAEIGYQFSDFDINFSGTGSRLNFPITDGRVNDNYHNIFLKIGYLF